jgi:hypothetical protein
MRRAQTKGKKKKKTKRKQKRSKAKSKNTRFRLTPTLGDPLFEATPAKVRDETSGLELDGSFLFFKNKVLHRITAVVQALSSIYCPPGPSKALKF